MVALKTDVLVIGGGAAGLRAAIEARRSRADVLLVSKTPAGFGNCTAYAGGGFQAPFGKMTPREHFERTVKGGKLLNNQKLVETMAREGAARLLELRDFGVDIRTGDGTASVQGSFAMNGTGLTFPLVEFARSSGIRIMQNIVISKLCRVGNSVTGAIGVNRMNGEVMGFLAKSTVLASGGAGRIYSRTDTPVGTTGEGYAMAYEIGATLIDMEFVQFFPFGLVEPGLPMFLFNPGVVEMGRLLNTEGKEFLKVAGFSPGRDFVQHRDTLSKLIWTEIHEGRGDGEAVLLDLAEPTETQYSVKMLGEFDEIRRKWLSKVDLAKQRLHIAPLVHYFMGGIDISENGATNLSGLFAAGEVTGGVDGANRLGGNALTNTIVFGARAGKSAADHAKTVSSSEDIGDHLRELEANLLEIRRSPVRIGCRPGEIRKRLQRMMVKCVGVIRSGETLENASGCLRELKSDLSGMHASSPWESAEALETKAMVTVSEIVVRSAVERRESRGAHYRLDCPKEDDKWLRNILVQRQADEMILRTRSRVVVEPNLKQET